MFGIKGKICGGNARKDAQEGGAWDVVAACWSETLPWCDSDH